MIWEQAQGDIPEDYHSTFSARSDQWNYYGIYPSISEFVVADILGGSKVLLFGNVIDQEFNVANNWNLGSGLSIVLMIFIFISMAIMNRHASEEGDNMLW